MARFAKLPLLRRYWLEFDVAPPPPEPPGVIRLDGEPLFWLLRRCGVTAHTLDDALWMVRLLTGATHALPPLKAVIEDVDVSTVLRERPFGVLGVPVWRGMWHPFPVQPLGRGSVFVKGLAGYRHSMPTDE